MWFAVLLAHLGYLGYVGGSRRAQWSMWLLWALLAGWPTGWTGKTPPFGLVTLRPGGTSNAVLPSAYVLVLLIVLASTTVWLWRDLASRSWIFPRRGFQANSAVRSANNDALTATGSAVTAAARIAFGHIRIGGHRAARTRFLSVRRTPRACIIRSISRISAPIAVIRRC